MEKLKLRFGATAEEAKEQPSSRLGLVYTCPKCKVGFKLKQTSKITNKVLCPSCNTEYEKP